MLNYQTSCNQTLQLPACSYRYALNNLISPFKPAFIHAVKYYAVKELASGLEVSQ